MKLVTEEITKIVKKFYCKCGKRINIWEKQNRLICQSVAFVVRDVLQLII